jgi:hypothetical protein
MSVGEVFARAFELWKRDVLWLIIAALVVGLVIAAIAGIAFAIIFGVALSGVHFGVSASGNSLNGVGAGAFVLAFIIYVVALFAIMVLAMTFYGGLFEMVIGAAKEDRPVRFGDLFSGFRKFGSYAMFALVMAGITFGLSLLNAIPFLGTIAMIVVLIWIEIIWLYVLPLIADQDLKFGEAASRSRGMVRDVGWWKTFGMVILLIVAIWAVGLVIAIIASLLNRSSSTVGSVVGGLLFIAFEAVVGPYAICYISVMYLGSGGAQPAVAGAGAPPPGYTMPPAPPAPPTAPVTTPAQVTPPVTPTPAVTPPTGAAAPAAGVAGVAGAAVAAEAAGTSVTEPAKPAGTAATEAAGSAETAAGDAAAKAEPAATDAAGSAETAVTSAPGVAAPEPPVNAPEPPVSPPEPPAPPASSPPPPPPLE